MAEFLSTQEILNRVFDRTTNKLNISSTSSGDFVGPASSTDNAIVRFDGATGKLGQNSIILISDTGVLSPGTNDTGALGSTTLQWSDLFLAEGGVINWDNGDVTITQTGNVLTFAGATTRYEFDTTLTPTANDGAALGTTALMFSDLFLASGSVVNWNNGDVTLTHAANTLAFAGASSGYSFDAAVLPSANDAAALGSATVSWSDLFMATGSLINIANGNWVATHSSGILTVSTGDLRVTTAGSNAASAVTVGGSQTLTNKILTSATVTTKISPTSDDGAPLGDTTHNFSDLFLATGAVLNFANGNVAVTHSSGILTMGTGDLQITTAGTNAASVVTNAGTQTLTNKRKSPRTGSVASSATPTINTDNVDNFDITALAAAITSMTTNLSGTPTTDQTFWLSITDNGTARAITWGASFESSGTIALPTTTVISTRLDVGFVWNTVTSKWRCVAVA